MDSVVEAGKEVWRIELKFSLDSEGRKLSGLESLQERVSRLGRKTVMFLRTRKQLYDCEVIEAGPLLRRVLAMAHSFAACLPGGGHGSA